MRKKRLIERFLDACDEARESGHYEEAERLGRGVAMATGTPYEIVSSHKSKKGQDHATRY